VRGRWLLIAGLVALALAALLLMVTLPAPPRGPAPSAMVVPTAVARPPTAVPPIPIPPQIVDRKASFTVRWGAQPTPEPASTPPSSARRRPSPTPAVHECVAVRYSVGVLPGTLGRILVDVRLDNRCGRDLTPLEVWFRVDGYRHGELVQSVSGHPFEAIARDGEGKASIVLSGSIDWYDRIDVYPAPPDTR
jgi:hypothetical protein